MYLSVHLYTYVTVYTCNYNALLKATTIAQAGRQTDKHTVGQTDIQRKLTQHIHNLHVKLISFNLNAIWRRFTCCVPRLLRCKCTSICQILCGRYRYLHRDTTSRCCSAAAAHWFSANDAMRHVRASVNYAFIFMIYAFWLTALVVKVFLNFPLQNQIFSRGILVQCFIGIKGFGKIEKLVDIFSSEMKKSSRYCNDTTMIHRYHFAINNNARLLLVYYYLISLFIFHMDSCNTMDNIAIYNDIIFIDITFRWSILYLISGYTTVK